MATKLQPKGHWPRVNIILGEETDYVDNLYSGSRGGGPHAVRKIRMHLDIPIRESEASRIGARLAAGKLRDAHRIVSAAMDRRLSRRDPLGKRGRAFVAAAFSGRAAGGLQPKGHWPRVNFLVTTDYADVIAGKASSAQPMLTVHMDVAVTSSESKALAGHLGASRPRLGSARTVVEGAMDRVVPAGAPEGRRGRALVKAAFSR